MRGESRTSNVKDLLAKEVVNVFPRAGVTAPQPFYMLQGIKNN
ncbi:Uncharacterised protein [Acetobacterium wieringae]|nr:Uncharacterised protein [Acetobacterium wieringae]